MKTYNKYITFFSGLVLFCAVMQLFTGCERRPLEDEVGDLALVPIHIDWAQSGLDVSQAHSVSVWFFPHDGSASFEHRYDGNLFDMEVLLPKGAYSIIVFNETVDFNWSSLQFVDSKKFDTFRVSTRQDIFRGLSARGDEIDVRKSPDAIASWSSDRFEVSIEMIYATAKNSRLGDSNPLQRIDAILKPLTKVVKIKAYVQNLTSALRCSGTITGAVGDVMLSTGKAKVNDVLHMFILNDRIYDQDNPNNGYIHANFLIFNAANSAKNILEIDFQLTNGTESSADPFNVTDSVTPDEPVVEVNVGAGIVGEEHDHPIILPEVEVGGDVGVDNWTNENIPIT